MASLPISLQLYTVRDQVARDYAGAMKAIAKIGYRAVEIGGFGDMKKAADARKALDDAGLTASGAHVSIDSYGEPGKILDEHELLGHRQIVCPWLHEKYRNAEGYRTAAGICNKFAAAAKERGFAFAYHNHSFEFAPCDGRTGMDVFLEAADPELVKCELDVYWVKHGGLEPIAYLNKLGRRVTLLHLKDMEAGPEQRFAQIGAGILDFPAIMAAGKKLGVRWGIVEQDNCYDVPTLDAARNSLAKLKELGLA